MSDNHPAARTNFHPDFRSVDLPAPSFKTEMPHVDGPPVQPPPTPAPYRDVSTGLTQTAVDSIIAEAQARGDQVYLKKLLSACVADGFAVPDELTNATARIVPPKAPTD